MPTKVDSYKCDICGSYYIKEEEALECEKLHVASEKLEIGTFFYKQDLEYPILLTIDDGSGHGALYIQKMEGSVEDVFENYEKEKLYIRNNPDEEFY